MSFFDHDFSADEKVNAWVLNQFKGHSWYPKEAFRTSHLRECPEIRVEHVNGSDGSYGGETGCEYWRMEAVIVCPHDTYTYEYAGFGQIAEILEDLA